MRDQRSDDRRAALAALREHSKGDGNFPRTRAPDDVVREAPEDRGIDCPDRPEPERPRVNARRSAAAKREAMRAKPRRRSRSAMDVPLAPRSSERSARKAAVERRPGVGKRRTGTAKTAKPKTVRGSRAGRGT
jgi:hypothetical protein